MGNALTGGDKIGRESAKILAKVAKEGVKIDQHILECAEKIVQIAANPQISVDPSTLTAVTGLGDRAVTITGVLGSTVEKVTSCVAATVPWRCGADVAKHAMSKAGDAYANKKYAEAGVAAVKHLSTGLSDTGKSLGVVSQHLEGAASHLENGLGNISGTFEHKHSFEIGERAQQTIVTSAKVVGGAITLVGGAHVARSTYNDWRNRRDFKQDANVLVKLQIPGYASRLNISERAKFQEQANKAMLRSVGKLPAPIQEMYCDDYKRQFTNNT